MSKYVNFDTKNYRAIVNPENGYILAYSKSAQHYKVETNVNNKVNPFPYTDEDFIILKTKETIHSK